MYMSSDRHKRYEEFLKRVLMADSHADTYSDVNDLLNRHKTLQDAYDVRQGWGDRT